MRAVARAYSGKGAKDLFNVVEKRKTELESLMRSVKGFVSYTVLRSGDDHFSITVCQDKAGVDESVQKAKERVAKSAGNTGVGAPKVSDGPVVIHVK
jgi:heme-degrading monooxygenase HmoA